jgi:hypothetical protein
VLIDRKNSGSFAGRGNEFFSSLQSPEWLYDTPSPLQWVKGTPSLRVKQPRREADQIPVARAEVKREWSSTSIPRHPKRRANEFFNI